MKPLPRYMPRVSVIIPTHSRPSLLPRAVESAKAAGADVEVVVVDDASADETGEVCRRLSGIRYVRVERNQGTAGARNIGVLVSTAPYLAFLDDDDERLPDSLDRQIRALDEDPAAGMVYSRVLLVNHDGQSLHPEPSDCPAGDVFWQLLERNFMYPQSALVRRECFLRVGLFKSAIAGIDEWDLWVRIAELYPVVFVDGPVSRYRLPHSASDQLTTNLAAELFVATARHQLELFRLPRAASAPADQRRLARGRLLDLCSDKLLLGAREALSDGSRKRAHKRILAALRLNPFRAARPLTFKLILESWL